ncbi:MAG TPA: Mur ligase family protein [Steroidobacteraceae bacterium]|nr:Mur ligase family protein [Steroidobacteraceae bacterium]
MLELAGVAADEALIEGWRARVGRGRARLGWAEARLAVRPHARGTSLAIAAPPDQLFAATELNEWALCATLAARDPARWAGLEAGLLAAALEEAADPATVVAPVLEEAAALTRLAALAGREARPALVALLDAAQARGLPHVLDETLLTLGSGARSRGYALEALPAPAAVPWAALGDIPTALVTGSNGKTTTVRLLAACARAHGWRAGFNCTDGVFLDGEALASGDYSGPAGTRRVLREPRVEAAILETARGGILRRGIAASQAQVAVVTNVSSDHFGEYGIHDLDGLADVKLAVAAVVAQDGLLVLNADDPLLAAKAGGLAARFGRRPPLGWFAHDADAAALVAHRRAGGATAGVRAGRLAVAAAGREHDLGPVAAMPLSVDGAAAYNVANLAAAALAAVALGIPPATVAAVCARFGADPADNLGRLMRFDVGGVQVLLDYAHNPDGLRGLLGVAAHLRGAGRLGLLLGHAGNRRDEDIEELARVAASFRPQLVVIKENEAHLRGRAPGEIPAILRAELVRAGLAEDALPVCPTELEAARRALAWARPGDVLALLVHSPAARAAVLALLRAPGAAPVA